MPCGQMQLLCSRERTGRFAAWWVVHEDKESSSVCVHTPASVTRVRMLLHRVSLQRTSERTVYTASRLQTRVDDR
jgi:hypothetical protein